jgi:hypothetical protein
MQLWVSIRQNTMHACTRCTAPNTWTDTITKPTVHHGTPLIEQLLERKPFCVVHAVHALCQQRNTWAGSCQHCHPMQACFVQQLQCCSTACCMHPKKNCKILQTRRYRPPTLSPLGCLGLGQAGFSPSGIGIGTTQQCFGGLCA